MSDTPKKLVNPVHISSDVLQTIRKDLLIRIAQETDRYFSQLEMHLAKLAAKQVNKIKQPPTPQNKTTSITDVPKVEETQCDPDLAAFFKTIGSRS